MVNNASTVLQAGISIEDESKAVYEELIKDVSSANAIIDSLGNPDLIRAVRTKMKNENGDKNLINLLANKALELEDEISNKTDSEAEKTKQHEEEDKNLQQKWAKEKAEKLEDLMKQLEGNGVQFETREKKKITVGELKKIMEQDFQKGFTILVNAIKDNDGYVRQTYNKLWDAGLPLEDLKIELKKLRDITDKFSAEFRQLPNDKFVKGDLKRLPYTTHMFFKKITVQGSDEQVRATALHVNKHMSARVRFNGMVNMLNNIEKSNLPREEKDRQAMLYFTTKVAWQKGGQFVGLMKRDARDLRYEATGQVGSAKRFNDKYSKAQDTFLSSLPKDLSPEIVTALKKRIDYYYQHFVADHYGMKNIKHAA